MTSLHKIEGTEIDFKSLKSSYKVPIVLSSISAALMGGINNSFMRSATIMIDIDKGFKSFATFIMLAIAIGLYLV